VFDKIDELYILLPGPITQFSPITTFGPIIDEGSTCADGCIQTLPIMFGPYAKL
jgi:hypothetical protein